MSPLGTLPVLGSIFCTTPRNLSLDLGYLPGQVGDQAKEDVRTEYSKLELLPETLQGAPSSCGVRGRIVCSCAEGEGSQAASKSSQIFLAFLKMRCKYIHYNVIPLMKTDQHFRRSRRIFQLSSIWKPQRKASRVGRDAVVASAVQR